MLTSRSREPEILERTESGVGVENFGNWESESGVRNFGKFESESHILPLTPQPWYQLFSVLCRPNELNFTQLIAVAFTTVRPITRNSQRGRGGKNHTAEHNF